MKNNLVIYPSKKFINKKINNIFINKFCLDHYEEATRYDFIRGNLSKDYREKNYRITENLFKDIISIIKKESNRIKKKDFNINFYEIILGTWLRKFIQQFVYKYKLIQTIDKKKLINEVIIFDTDEYLFYTSETHTIQHATNDIVWNACLFSYIFENIPTQIKLKKIKNQNSFFYDKNFLHNKKSSKKISLKDLLKLPINFLTEILPNKSKVFLYHTGFEFFDEKYIDVKLNQFFRIYPKTFNYEYSNYQKDLRLKYNFEKYLVENSDEEISESNILKNLILKLLSKSLPIFFVEDFDLLLDMSNKVNFPINPEIILTSYAFEANEVFKFYVANNKHTNKDLKYIIYQHGGSYITRIDNSFNNECRTSDVFLTWGTKTDQNLSNNVSAFNFKLLNKKYFYKKKSNSLLILLRSSGYNAVPYDRYLEGQIQLEFTMDFLKKIDKDIKLNTIVRAHYSSKNRLKNFEDILKNFKIDYGEVEYFKALNDCKLILFNHDSTGMLETIATNKPTICAWPNYKNHLNNFVIDDYKYLIDAKILFDDNEKLAQHLRNVWQDPLNWWLDNNTQKNINIFLEKYSSKPKKNFGKDLINIMRSI